MTWSIGEIGALAIKAARGSGMEWGLAEEAGYAVKWLQSHHLPGVSALCKYLSWRQNVSPSIWPNITGESGDYCPIAIGAAYSDGLFGDEAQFSRVRLPILLAPFVALRATDQPKTLSIGNIVLSFTPDGIGCKTNKTAMLVDSSACQISTTCHSLLSITRIKRELPRVPTTTTACINILNGFAKNTYAPATEESRLSGAGAGLNDND